MVKKDRTEAQMASLGSGTDADLGTRYGRDNGSGHDRLGGARRGSGIPIPPWDCAARVRSGDEIEGH